MGATCCADENPSRKSFFTFSKSTLLTEGYLEHSIVDMSTDQYSDLQLSLSHHWSSLPKDSKSTLYLMRK